MNERELEQIAEQIAGVRLAQPAPAHRGTNQAGMRAFNERLVLSLVRRHGSIAKSEIARMIGLSAQTVSVIMRSLERDELVIRGEPIRGKVGQPLMPLSINPQGAYFLGLKVGRRSADFVLVDFLGAIRFSAHETYAWPVPEAILAFAEANIERAAKALGSRAQRIAGLGIAMPFELWNWADEVDAPRRRHGPLAQLRHSSRAPLRSAPGRSMCRTTPPPPAAPNWRSARPKAASDFVYFYIGAFAGGGIVLNGSLYRRPTSAMPARSARCR